jgi:hypothetical protein
MGYDWFPALSAAAIAGATAAGWLAYRDPPTYGRLFPWLLMLPLGGIVWIVSWKTAAFDTIGQVWTQLPEETRILAMANFVLRQPPSELLYAFLVAGAYLLLLTMLPLAKEEQPKAPPAKSRRTR